MSYLKPCPDSGLDCLICAEFSGRDCLICAEFARQRKETPAGDHTAVWSLESDCLSGSDQLSLRILVYLVIYGSGQVSLEHLLPSWYPSPESIIRRNPPYVPTVLPTVGALDDPIRGCSRNPIEVCYVGAHPLQGYLAHKKQPPPNPLHLLQHISIYLCIYR